MSDDRLEQLDYYTLLGLDEGASVDAIRDAFHRFALKFHPDNHAGASSEKRERATQIYRRGAEAYRVLLEPELRTRYDHGLGHGHLRLRAEETPSAGLRRTNAQPSTKARPFYRKALSALETGDTQTARLNLRIAQGHDPECALLAEKLAELDALP
ncbi:MAG: DnaJ domain-containing protein [Deltaproteobacteria bacterium]|nr:DnaJ domain-containing protein [Deltaproteobacteria bacterium]